MVELFKYSAGSDPFPTSFHHSQMMALIFPPSSPLTYSVTKASSLLQTEERSPPRTALWTLLRVSQGLARRATTPILCRGPTGSLPLSCLVIPVRPSGVTGPFLEPIPPLCLQPLR